MGNEVATTELKSILKRINAAGVSFDTDRLHYAFHFAQDVYGDDVHWLGNGLLEHCLGTLEVLMPFEPDEDAVIACLLHHALETKRVTIMEIEEQFGMNVRKLISGVQLLSHITTEGRRQSIDDLRLMLLSVSDDVRTILITLCERRYVLDFVEEMEEEQRKRFCSDVLQLFAPVAARLGIYSLKHQLEARAFPVLYPSDAERIDQQYCEFYRNKGNFLDSAASQLQVMLGERGVQAQIEAREKELFSIFTKMRRKSLSHVDRVHDLFAVRVIVRTIEECYQTLGVLHNIGRPVQDRFKDYIAFPKPNGYQSLHTTLTQLPGTPPNTFVEVQVRTHAMHREAKFGVAAHWSYKEHGSTDYALEQAQLHRMIAGQHSIEQEGTRETLVDHIFVLTPKGDVFELPEGATTLDFAFQIHTDLGLHFQFARVNGSIVSLDYELENGDVVEIQKRKTPQPSPRWMQLLAMASSRSKLKRYLYSQERPMFIVKGRVLMNKELRKHGLPPLDGDLTLLRNCDGSVLPHQKREDILMKIGQGSENASSLLARLDDLALHHKTRSKPSVPGASCPLPKSKSRSAVQVAGGVPMPTRFAQCCKPEEKMSPSIVGIINRHGEVMVHCSECHMLRNVNPGRQIAVQWES